MKKEEAIERLTSYLGSAAKVTIEPFGEMLNVSVSYMDGKPMCEVRAWINDNVDNLLNLDIERLYSEETIKQALLDLYNEDDDLVLRIEYMLLRKEIAPTHHEQVLP